MFRKISVLLFLVFSLNLCSEEVPDLIWKASKLYQTERAELRNYKVQQTVESVIRSDGSLETEKRIQSGLFIAPSKFVFAVREKEVNGKIVLKGGKEIERSEKKEIEWLSSDALPLYKFELIEKNDEISKFRVIPKRVFPEARIGEIWISPKTLKIRRMIKQPVTLQKDFISYRTEIFFEKDFAFQEPTKTVLDAVYISKGRKYSASVTAVFTDYTFNLEGDFR
ncbi:MAG TPA: hypothetical protein PKN56_05405 [Leptospiraceae bacterium]|nr:hypothetical protein [Leptospiraceae bacterium]